MAEERAGGDLVGAVTLHLAWPDAVLPAPLPPLRQLRACICNLAVAPRSRRRGVARLLLQRCEEAARWWGQDSVWLQADPWNEAALDLYHTSGYATVEDVPWHRPFRVVMRKELPGRRAAGPGEPDLLPGNGAGVFIWKAGAARARAPGNLESET